MTTRIIHLTVNGRKCEGRAEDRLLLVHFLREELGLTGTHIGCNTGHCGACTIMLNGVSVKSCMVLAVQSEGAEITSVEGLECVNSPLIQYNVNPHTTDPRNDIFHCRFLRLIELRKFVVAFHR